MGLSRWVCGTAARRVALGKQRRADFGSAFTAPPDSYSNWLRQASPTTSAASIPRTIWRSVLNDLFPAGTTKAICGNINGFIVEYDIPRTAECTGRRSTLQDHRRPNADFPGRIVRPERRQPSASRPSNSRIHVSPRASAGIEIADVVHGLLTHSGPMRVEDSRVPVWFAQVPGRQGGRHRSHHRVRRRGGRERHGRGTA